MLDSLSSCNKASLSASRISNAGALPAAEDLRVNRRSDEFLDWTYNPAELESELPTRVFSIPKNSPSLSPSIFM